MEQTQVDKVRELAREQRNLAERYCEARRKAGVAKKDLDLLLVIALPGIRDEKKNVGMDMAYIMLMEGSKPGQAIYDEWQTQEAEYKALEKLIDAYQSSVMVEMAAMPVTAPNWRVDMGLE